MDVLKRTIDQIGEQLSHLNTSQRIAIALCAVVVAGSFVWLVSYSTSPEMVAVLAQDMSLPELEAAMDALKGEGINHEQRGNRLHVRTGDRNKAMLSLNRAGALPQDTSVGFAELMADENPFRPQTENEWRRRVALGTELARIVSSADDVDSARVIIQDKAKRRIGVGSVKPSASVFVKMRNGKALTHTNVDAMCRLISGAVPGLSAHEVTVMDATTMRAFSVPDPEDALGIGLLEERKKNEAYLASKIAAALRSIPGVLVSVSVDLDASKIKTQKTIWDKSAVRSEEAASTNTESASGPGETGVNPNVGVALSANPTGTKAETDDSKTEFFPQNPMEVVNEEKAPFSIRRATASIGIPRGFLVGIHQARFGEDIDAASLDDDATFLALKDAEINRVRSSALSILMSDDETDVDVGVFYDFAEGGAELSTFPGGGIAIASTDGGAMHYVQSYGMQAGLVVLALISFMTMARMVRKSSDLVKSLRPADRQLDDDDAAGIMQVSGGPVGSAGVSEGLLVGQEVDEETLRFSQLGDQVSKMVDEDPQTAADLIQRWTQQDK